jgi:hypothetical protein
MKGTGIQGAGVQGFNATLNSGAFNASGVLTSAHPGLSQSAAVTRQQAEPRWHAHLSALSRSPPANSRQPAVAAPAQPRYSRELHGVSLDPAMLGIPLHVRPKAHRGFLSCTECDASFVKVNRRDDASGRQRWVVRPVQDAPGEYNVLVSGGRPCVDRGDAWYLSVPMNGSYADVWYRDDASGRQRWVFDQLADNTYSLRVAGGKADTDVYLGVDEDDGAVRLYSDARAARTRWELARPQQQGDGVADGSAGVSVGDGPAGDGVADGSAGVSAAGTRKPSGDTAVPRDALPELTKLTGMTDKQIDVVLQLISLPENGHPRWHANYDYIEFLGDGRGFTVTLYGACSGTGDLAMIFDELARISPRSAACDELLTYHDQLRKKRGDDIKGIEPIKRIIQTLGDDPAWRKAVWKVYVKLYWRFAMDWADKRGACARRPGPVLALPVSRGFMVDVAINHGADYESVMEIVKRMPEGARNDKNELTWLRAFADARQAMLRSGYQHLDTSRTGDRCQLWKALAASGNTALTTPFKAHSGYWGSYTIK